MEFLNAKSRSVMRMLADRCKDIEKAYAILEVVSQDEEARLLYEAREKQIRDEISREGEYRDGLLRAREEGREEGEKKGKKEGREEIMNAMKRSGMTQEEINRMIGHS